MKNPSTGVTGFAIHKDQLKAWSETNTSSNIPRFQYATKDNDTSSNITSDRFLTNASTLTLQNVNFGYSLPSNLVHRLHLTKLRLYVSGQNLCYFSHRKGFDPRSSFWGSATATDYAQERTITGGISVQF